jgi:hypothetical protein
MKKAIEDIKKSASTGDAGEKPLGVLLEEKKFEQISEKGTKTLDKTLKDEVGKQLEDINKTLKDLKDSFNKPSRGKEDKETPGESTKLGEKEAPVTLKEKLMSAVGGIRARREATKEFLKAPIKNIKESIGGFASSVQNKAYERMGDIGDIISAPAGYNPEKEQFAKDYGLRTEEGRARDQSKRDEMRERILKAGYDKKEAERRLKEADEYVSDETMAEGRKRYEATKGAQQELAGARGDISSAKKRGFEATDTEQARLEAAQTNLAAIDPRVREAEQNLKEVKAEGAKASEKENDDNVVTSQEAMAKSMEENNVIIADLLETSKQQLDSVRKISESISPKEPVDLDLQYQPITKKLDELITTVKEKEFTGGSGGVGGSLLDTAKDLLGGRGKGGAAGKAAGAASRFSRLGTVAKVGGAALAVAGGAYAAYSGFSEASDEQKAALADIEAKKKSGELTAEQADAMTKQVNEQATEKKGGAVGEGVGMAAGGLAGMKLGAALGSFAGPVGTVVGGVAGGAIGAFAGSSLGKKAGELGGKVMNYFTGDTKQEIPADAVNTTTGAAAFPLTPPGDKAKPVKATAASKEVFSKDYTKDPKYQKLLQEEQEVIRGRNVRTAGEGREASETLSVSQVREAEREAKARYLQQGGGAPNVAPVKKEPSSLGNLSVEYNDQIREAAQSKPAPAPVIMNNTTNNSSGTQFAPMKAVPRSHTNSSLDKHLDRVSTY